MPTKVPIQEQLAGTLPWPVGAKPAPDTPQTGADFSPVKVVNPESMEKLFSRMIDLLNTLAVETWALRKTLCDANGWEFVEFTGIGSTVSSGYNSQGVPSGTTNT